MKEIIAYTLVNDEGNFISMTGGETDDWFKASKFDEEGIESRKVYLKCGFKLKKFKVIEEDE